MAYKGFSGSGTVGNFLSTTQLELQYPAVNHAGRRATVEATVGQVTPYFCDGVSWNAEVTATTNPVTGGIDLSAGGSVVVKNGFTSAVPYKAAFWGDSRYNGFPGSGTDVSQSGSLSAPTRSPMWICSFLGDTEYYKTYAVSGDTAPAWQSISRTAGKTFVNLNASDVDIVFIQYGVNDAMVLTSAATLTGYLQNLVAEILKSGKLVVFESIYPVNTPASQYVAAQATIDTVNANIQTWLANFSSQAVYVDTATTFKAGGTYASSTYIAAADGIHPTRLGAYTSGKLVAAGARNLLPRRSAEFYGPASASPNMLNLTSPFPILTQFNSMNQGTATVVQSSGQDSAGYYYEWNITPLTFGTTYTEAVLQLSVNFQTTSPPYYALTGNEVLQGGAKVLIDDGFSGAPNAYAMALRCRFFTGAVFSDIGGAGGAPTALDTKYNEKFSLQMLTPRLPNNGTASAVANPAVSSGLMLQLIVDSETLNVPYRVRLYNPQIRRVGFTSAAVSSTVGASPATITNTTNGPQQYFISGGTVSGITFNGIATGLTSGAFVLDPGDALVVTHTVAPTQVVKQLLTQPTLRNFI